MSFFIRNEGGFFSDYYLAELLQRRHKGKLGENTRRVAWRRLSHRWDRVTRSLGGSSTGAKTRRLWLMPLFGELGYELVSGPTFFEERQRETKISCSHVFHPDSSKPPLVYVDLHPWGQDLESPLPGEGRRNTPRRKMERILDMGDARWGIVSNGRVIRLLRREQVGAGRRYFEVDLENVFEEADESSFAVFWALFRAEVFVPDESGQCLIDMISEGCQHYAVRVSDELRESVRRALEDFVRGVMGEPANREVLREVDAKELFGQGLIFLYRLLFVLYAESRDLLPIGNPIYRQSYSLEALRDSAEDPNERFSSGEYWIQKSLQVLFRMIREGVAAGDLMVPAYDGGLFQADAAPLLESCRVPDSCLARVIETLSVTAPQRRVGRERIAYRELGVEELGAIYEGLLQYEPKIASEEMAVVQTSGSEEIILPLRSVTKEAVVERIPAGTFYLATWGGSRKQSGTYNTPLKITEWLVRQALEPLVEGKGSEEILELNVLDPAMGSGAFLVSACHFLADAYAAALVAEGKEIVEHIDEEAKAEYRRLVAERCLYGIDLNPLAVELAKVSLWLTTIAKGKPLTFLDQNLVSGDSIIGVQLEDLSNYPWSAVGKREPRKKPKEILHPNQLSLYDVGAFGPSLTSLVKSFETLESIPDETLEMIQRKAYLFEEDRKEGSFYARCKEICDLWCSLWFWPEGAKVPDEKEYKQLLQKVMHGSCRLPENKVETYLGNAKRIAAERRFLHWELVFPAIFFDFSGRRKAAFGFDAIIGNPPWETILTNSKEFFSAFDPRFRTLSKGEARKRAQELRSNNKDIDEQWKSYKLIIDNKNNFFRESGHFPNHGRGHLNSFRIFLERSFNAVKDSGLVAMIVPSSINSDKGATDLRHLLFGESQIDAWVHFVNRKKIFPIHSSFEFVLLVTQKGGASDKLPCAFFKDEISVLDKFESFALSVPITLIRKFSPRSLSVMKFKSQRDVNLLEKIYKDHPLIGEYRSNTWNVDFNAEEFNKTHDDAMFNREKKGWPVFEGGVFHQFQHNFSSPEIWMEEDKGLNELSKRYMKRLGEKNRNLLAPLNYRLAFRLVASNTNFRTMISAILPPKVFLTNSAPYAYLRKTSKKLSFPYPVPLDLLCYVCGILNSFVTDYVIRQKMAENLNLFYVRQTPLPRLSADHPVFKDICKRVARLTATTEEYRDFAERMSVELGPLTEGQRQKIIAEIDAIVALLYGLDKEDLEHILSTFPLVGEEQKKFTIEKFSQFFKSSLLEHKQHN